MCSFCYITRLQYKLYRQEFSRVGDAMDKNATLQLFYLMTNLLRNVVRIEQNGA